MAGGCSRTDVDALRWNERLKAGSAVAANLGSALFASGFARWFTLGFDAIVLIWIVVAAMIIWSSNYAMTGLEADQTDG
jgi:hypothetical protein